MTAELPLLPGKVTAFRSPDAPTMDDLSRCVHCGLCLMNCPTFVATGLEPESPRGRIYLLRAVAEGRIDLTEAALPHLERCLQCRNCEAVCPSGVPFGRLMEGARAEILARGLEPARRRVLRSAVLRGLLPYRKRLQAVAGLLRLYQRVGLQRLVHTRALGERLPARLRELEELAPPISARSFANRPEPWAATGERAGQVALFSGCIMPFTHADTHRATVRVLQRSGCDVLAPPAQTCCGALMLHAGDQEGARAQARRNIDTFLALDIDAIVVNAAGCGSALKEYDHLLARDPDYHDKAKRFAGMVKDASEFVVQQRHSMPLGTVRARVTYQDSCHLAHAQRITEPPRQLIQAIPGVELVEMAHPDRCCGSAGIYNITQPQLSGQILAGKMDEVAEVAPDIVVTANPGCMIQLEAGVRSQGGTARVMHVMDLLDLAYRSSTAATPDASGQLPG